MEPKHTKNAADNARVTARLATSTCFKLKILTWCRYCDRRRDYKRPFGHPSELACTNANHLRAAGARERVPSVVPADRGCLEDYLGSATGDVSERVSHECE